MIVPVLSVHKSSIAPKSCTEESRFTITCFSAKRSAPRESEKVITSGNASGITETASAIAKMRSPGISAPSPSMSTFATTTNASVTTVVRKIKVLIRSTPRLKSLTFSAVDADCAICARRVFPPVAVTSAYASPRTIMTPWRSLCSSLVLFPFASVFTTGTLSPVNAVSSTCSPVV